MHKSLSYVEIKFSFSYRYNTILYTYKKVMKIVTCVLYFSDICQLLIKSASKVAYVWFLNIGD